MSEQQQIEMVADRLSQEAIAQGRKAIVGILAVPTSIALGLAATVTWATAFLERGFDVFEQSLDRVRLTGEDQTSPMLGRGDERPSKKSAQAEQQARS
jgi:hypothetical protein